MNRLASAWIVVCLSAVVSEARQTPLTVLSRSPEGEVASLAQANEIRIVFSEPMVVLGRIPDRVVAPFFKITPAVPGTFRWSGTTILIFTPDAKQPLPWATDYEVTIATAATAVSGRRLPRSLSFRFTTPTARLLSTHWYRGGGTVNGPVVIALRFNQPMRSADVLSAMNATLTPHDWDPPMFTAEETERLHAVDPQALSRFNARVIATRAVTRATNTVALRIAADWDKKQLPPSPDLVVLETTTKVEPESWVTLTLGPRLRSSVGSAVPGTPQRHTVKVERAFFIEAFSCRSECDGDRSNAVQLRGAVKTRDFAAVTTATDITTHPRAVPKRPTSEQRREYGRDAGSHLTLEDAGFDTQPPNTKYMVVANASLQSLDGQTLGYTWLGIVDNWHMRGFTSFGDGHGVWEKSNESSLPFYARNVQYVTKWTRQVRPQDLMPTLLQLQHSSSLTPDTPGTLMRLAVSPDRLQSHGIDISGALLPGGTGLVWTAVRDGALLPRTKRSSWNQEPQTRASLVQVTNLGITVKDSPRNTLVFVTSLDTGAPVEGARVSIVRLDNSVFWRGTTNADGLAVADNTPLRAANRYWDRAFEFLVTAEKDGDVAYVGSDWNEGITPWEMQTGIGLYQSTPVLVGSVFADRGVYRLGEEVHFKAILRHNTPTGVELLPANTAVAITIRDSQSRVVDERTIDLNGWSSAEWKWTLPADGALGEYSLQAVVGSDQGEDHRDAIHRSFLVAAYRRPDFRVDVTMTSSTRLAGEPITGVVQGRYLFGATMGTRPVTWGLSASPTFSAPSTVTERYSSDRWAFVGWRERGDDSMRGDVAKEDATLTKAGDLTLSLDTKRDAGVPYVYTLEGDVEDVSRQRIANRASLLIHPAPWYIGLRRPDYFLKQSDGYKTEIVTVAINGATVPNIPVVVTLTQVQWNSVRRAEGNGFYTWDTERREVPAGQWTVTTQSEPLPFHIPVPSGGYFIVEAKAQAEEGRFTRTITSFYALGDGYTAWARYDHPRIDLVPERQTYRPGDTARIMIQSPWEQATALITTEREGIRTYRRFALTSTQQAVDVPITEDDIPNLFVSVVLIKGRTQTAASADSALAASSDTSDPGKPAFRLGYVELGVEDRAKRLTVNVTANREEYRPAASANVRVNVKDQQQRGARAELTLWAVDYGVLSLTDYHAPDVASSVYIRKQLQVFNEDNRQRIISRRVLSQKGDSPGGGGGQDASAGTLRKDFRVLAFWIGSVVTDDNGDANIDVKLPESLTTYRIMAIAADRTSRFGSGDTEIRTNKPLTLKPTFPRFLAVGDSAYFGAVLTSQLPVDGIAVVSMTSADANAIQLTGPLEQRVTIPAGGAVEVRFDAKAIAIGRARMRMRATMGDESDGFEDLIPVEVLASPETVAAYGEATDANRSPSETLKLPTGVVAGFGGLQVQLASTALVGLGEGARYLVEYPYGCAEQKTSRALALLLAADLGDSFTLPGMNVGTMRSSVQDTIKALEQFQCSGGGFAYWPGKCDTVSPYLTAYVLHMFNVARSLKYDVNPDMRGRAVTYLERELATPPPTNESWWPAYTAWKAFAAKVVVEAGGNQDSTLTRLYGYRDRMPVFAIAYLHDALLARGETSGARVDDLRRRMSNAVLPEAGSAHVEELSDPYLLWFWNSNVRSTAIVLNSLAKAGVSNAPFRPLVRWLLAARKDGRWGNTQENAYAMEALVTYYRKYEPVVPNFTAIVRLGEEELTRERFEGRSTTATTIDVPINTLASVAGTSTIRPLTFSREGAGTLFYTARLRYAVDALFQSGLDSGFRIERRYEPYVEGSDKPAPMRTSFNAGDLVRVTLTLRLTKERRFVAVTDPLPAGFEPVESWFATTARDLAQDQQRQSTSDDEYREQDSWTSLWRFGGFNHVERHDDRVNLFATRLSEGVHVFSYVARATTAGMFRTAPARAEEMYTPEIFGRTGTAVIEVSR